jgi:hypothetical protein
MRRALTFLAAMSLLAGCGSVTRLRPHEGMTEVPKAANADRRETAPELMTPSTQAQPDRQADLLIKSSERKVDPFALPPGPNNGQATSRPSAAATASPPPENTAQDKNTTGQGLPESIDADDDTPDEPPLAPGTTTP